MMQNGLGLCSQFLKLVVASRLIVAEEGAVHVDEDV
jgi:hypothetical protein